MAIHRLILLRCFVLLALLYLIYMDLQLYLYLQHLPTRQPGTRKGFHRNLLNRLAALMAAPNCDNHASGLMNRTG